MQLHNLPPQPTPLIGRQHDVEAARQQLLRPDVRLLSITGTAGVGKTRLALEVAARLLDTFEHGAFFVDLAPVVDRMLVMSAIAQTLGVREVAGQSVCEGLKEYLRDRQVLLMLDNFEQVVEAATGVADLLVACPRLKVLVTSRVPLHVRWEHEFPIIPLRLPDLNHLPPHDALADCPSVALFVERARAHRPDFALGEQYAAAVADICVRLDGLPLAIELAAARIKILSPDAIRARLPRRLDLLTSATRDIPARQKTLRDAIGWSYDLLSADEQALFRRLCVFVGGFTLDAAATIYPLPAMEVLEGLASLVDKSLMRQEAQPDGEPRFRMLETIREYALERLALQGELEDARQRHAGFFLAMAERAEPELWGPAQSSWLDRLEREHENLRAALGWTVEQGDAELGLRLATGLWRFWWVRGHLSEGLRWLDGPLARSDGAPRTLRARALNAAGNLARAQGDDTRAMLLYEECLALQREHGDQWGTALSLNNLAVVAYDRGDLRRARVLYEESLALFRELGDKRGVAFALSNLGGIDRDQDAHERALERYAESLRLFWELGDDQGIGVSLLSMAAVARSLGNHRRAIALYEESLAVFRQLDDRHGVAAVLNGLGQVSGDQRDYSTACARYEESLRVYREVGDRLGAAKTLESLARLAQSRGEHDRVTMCCDEALAIFRELGVEHGIAACQEMLAQARSERTQPVTVSATHGTALTRREQEVAGLVARGLTNRQIAAALVIAEGTAANHVEHIMNKLGFQSRAQIAVWAVEHGLSRPPKD